DHGMILSEGRSRRGPQMSATPDSTLANPEQRIADLERQLAERTAERDESEAQKTATAEVLQIINSSPGDLAPVFDAMLAKALRLGDAAFGNLVGFDGERFQTLAGRGLPAPYVEYLATTADRPGPGGGQQRVLRGERVVHFADMKDDEAYRSGKN